MPENKTITVTQEDIEQGIKEDTHRCAVALAVKRAMGWNDVLVGGQICNARAWESGHKEYKVPEEVRKFVWAFDRGDAVRPFTFELEEVS